MENKKAQLANLPTGIIALVVAVIMLVIGVVILQELRDSDSISASASATQNNETITTVTETGENFVASTRPAVVCSVLAVTNATDGITVPSANYTVTNCNIRYSGVTGAFNNTNWNVSYTSTYGDTVWTSANNTIVELGTFADFWEIIVLAVVVTVVIGLLLVVFGRPNRR